MSYLKFMLCCVTQLALASNLNTWHSIIYEDAHKGLSFAAGQSLFGYTTALHRGKSKPRIFIGAPKGFDYGMPSNNCGVVFKCGIKQHCEMLSLDNDSGKSRSRGLVYLDNKDNAWIGGTMDISSEADKLVVCGFRFKTDYVAMIGVCYLAKIEENLRFEKLLPLLDPGKQTMTFPRASVYFYALGQAGFSAQFTNDRQHPELLIGAPGLLNWYGGTILYSRLNSPSSIQHKVSKRQEDSFGLFGYAVSSGKYTGAERLYASSVPKGNNYLGSVVVYKFGQKNDSKIESKHILSGSQFGEYFGASLATGDLNNDGFDDLVIGAPFYLDKNYNDGRAHVYYGGKDFSNKNNIVYLTGSNNAGHFGTAITFLGDINLDGYGDIAIGEPYSDEYRGKVFIYHGGPHGLETVPVQVLEGRSIDHKLRGFGISVSKGVDIDGNGYSDISIGSHLSGHAVVIRSNPLVEIESSLSIMQGTKINITGTTTIRHCFKHAKNPYLPHHIDFLRTIAIDEQYQRLIISSPTKITQEFVLKENCEIIELTTKDKVYHLTEAVKISVSYKLLQPIPQKQNVYVGLNNTDTFCKTCPVLSNTRPLETEFSFALGCGNDDVCRSNLNFDVKFFEIENDTFVVGSAEVTRMEILVSNSGDSAYLTQLYITLPKHVRFVSIPKKCTEDMEGIMVCVVGNPLDKQVYLPILLNMKNVRTDYGTNLTFSFNVTTTSENKNPESHKTKTLQLKNIVDLKLLRKEPTLVFYEKNATFIQVYEVQKMGHSPADQIIITINLPTHIIKNNVSHSIVKLYSILGSVRGQPILCNSNSDVEYIRETMVEIEADGSNVDMEDIVTRLKRSTNLDSSEIIYTNNLEESTIAENSTIEGEDIFSQELINGKTVVLDCNDSNNMVHCTTFTCDIGTIKHAQDIAIIRIKALLDVSELKQFVKVEKSILLISHGHIDAEYEIDTISNNDIDITTTFLDSTEIHINMWILIIAICIGIALLMVLVFVLYKCGFFTRDKKLLLEEEKKQAADDEFLNGIPKEELEADEKAPEQAVDGKCSEEIDEMVLREM